MEQLCKQIYDCAKSGDADQMVRLAKSNPFIPASASIEPALFVACELGQLAVVRACVLELKCNPNSVDKSGRSALHMAVVRKCNGKIAIAIIKFLIDHGAKIRKSVLHVCCNDMAIFPLFEFGADINAKSVDGLTPIDVAVATDRHEVISELIRAGCDLSPQLIFKAKSAFAVRELVRNGLDPNLRDSNNCTPLHYAVESGNKTLARALLECKADPSLVSRSNSLVSSGSTQSGIPVGIPTPVVVPEDVYASMEILSTHMKNVHRTIMSLKTENDLEKFKRFTDWDEIEQLASSSAAAAKDIKNIIGQKNKNVSSTSLCTICRSETKTVVLMPCRHFCVCFSCSKALKTGGSWDSTCTNMNNILTALPACPICRAPIDDFVTVYT